MINIILKLIKEFTDKETLASTKLSIISSISTLLGVSLIGIFGVDQTKIPFTVILKWILFIIFIAVVSTFLLLNIAAIIELTRESRKVKFVEYILYIILGFLCIFIFIWSFYFGEHNIW